MTLSDSDFVTQLENCTLPPAEFSHKGHLRIAWLYLLDNDLEVAIVKATNAIRAYALSIGATGKFHYTLTAAALHIIRKRMSLGSYQGFEDFLARNPDLATRFRELILNHYSQERLDDKRARDTYIPPDIKDFFEPV